MKVGFVGWRGMVGSVLMQRMKEENDFAHIPEAFFFTTSNVGGAALISVRRPKHCWMPTMLPNWQKWTLSLPAKAAITPNPCSNPCATAAGTATGLTQLLPCA